MERGGESVSTATWNPACSRTRAFRHHLPAGNDRDGPRPRRDCRRLRQRRLASLVVVGILRRPPRGHRRPLTSPRRPWLCTGCRAASLLAAGALRENRAPSADLDPRTPEAIDCAADRGPHAHVGRPAPAKGSGPHGPGSSSPAVTSKLPATGRRTAARGRAGAVSPVCAAGSSGGRGQALRGPGARSPARRDRLLRGAGHYRRAPPSPFRGRHTGRGQEPADLLVQRGPGQLGRADARRQRAVDGRPQIPAAGVCADRCRPAGATRSDHGRCSLVGARFAV